MKYTRRDTCAICGKNYTIDTDQKTGTCNCGTFKIRVPDKEFLKLFFEEVKAE